MGVPIISGYYKTTEITEDNISEWKKRFWIAFEIDVPDDDPTKIYRKANSLIDNFMFMIPRLSDCYHVEAQLDLKTRIFQLQFRVHRADKSTMEFTSIVDESEDNLIGLFDTLKYEIDYDEFVAAHGRVTISADDVRETKFNTAVNYDIVRAFRTILDYQNAYADIENIFEDVPTVTDHIDHDVIEFYRSHPRYMARMLRAHFHHTSPGTSSFENSIYGGDCLVHNGVRYSVNYPHGEPSDEEETDG